jgi:flagellar hook protein FlgE
MSLFSSFYAGLSGLTTNASNLSVIGNNLANMNTIGYKGSSGTFQDLFASSLGSQGTQGNGNPIQIGLGSRLGGVSQNFGQGSYQSTSNVTDMAISGRGFFVMETNTGARVYSRAGDFTVSKTGFLQDPNGNQVLGWNRANGTVSITGTPGPIMLDMGSTAGAAITDTISSSTNLDANATKGKDAAWDAVNSVVTPYVAGQGYTTTMQIYDSVGASHNLVFTYTKSNPNAIKTRNAGTGAITLQETDPASTATAWDLSVTTDDPTVTVSGYPKRICFDSSGVLLGVPVNPSLTFSNGAGGVWANGAKQSQKTNPANSIVWTVNSGGVATITGLASDSTTSNAVQNGYGAGTIQSLMVNQNGQITGTFSNGQIVPLAQVALAVFSNQNGLSKLGDNTWGETLASGSGNIGAATSGGRGTVLGGNLELSNVDVAEEFTKLIIAQRGYEANSKIVTTTDQLLQVTLNLKQ